MSKAKLFKVGDKVFAKVKGYPAWPAIITEVFSTKYSVKFYGTGETGSVKPKDLFYYLKHKKTCAKSLKRKDYNDAVQEIENAIQEAGTDGNEESEAASDSIVSLNVSANDSVDNGSTKATKRKRVSSISSEKFNESQAKKKVPRSSTPASNAGDPENNEEILTSRINSKDKVASESNISKNTAVESTKPQNIPKPTAANNKTDEVAIEISANSKNVKESETNTEVIKNTTPATSDEVVDAGDIKIITGDYLQALISYAAHVKKNEEIYRKRPVEIRNHAKNEIVIAKLPDGKYVGIKYNREDPPLMKNEYEYVDYEESEAKTLLSLKKVVEEGSCKPEDDPNMFVTNLTADESQLQQSIKAALIERKIFKLKWLRIERQLIELDTSIKGCLGLDEANPENALEYLAAMLKLEIDPLMLKKYPHVVDMIKRLRRYIGNVKEWNMTLEERVEFEAAADKVKEIANTVYLKFAKLFGIDDTTTFWDTFTEAVEKFKHHVKDMSEGRVFALSSEPYSRQAFLDEIDDKEEIQQIDSIIDSPDKSHKAEKENSSKIANTDEAVVQNFISS